MLPRYNRRGGRRWPSLVVGGMDGGFFWGWDGGSGFFFSVFPARLFFFWSFSPFLLLFLPFSKRTGAQESSATWPRVSLLFITSAEDIHNFKERPSLSTFLSHQALNKRKSLLSANFAESNSSAAQFVSCFKKETSSESFPTNA